jgi:hypothetical protein
VFPCMEISALVQERAFPCHFIEVYLLLCWLICLKHHTLEVFTSTQMGLDRLKPQFQLASIFLPCLWRMGGCCPQLAL